MLAKDRAKSIRTEIKNTLGFTSTKISVKTDSYSMGASIDVAIKDIDIDIEEVRNIAVKHENVFRDKHTGDILAGGNTYVNVKYDCLVLIPSIYVAQGETVLKEFKAKFNGNPMDEYDTIRYAAEGWAHQSLCLSARKKVLRESLASINAL